MLVTPATAFALTGPPIPLLVFGASLVIDAVALAFGVVASAGWGTPAAAPASGSPTLSSGGPVAGTVFVAKAGAQAQGAGVSGPGSVTVYGPGAPRPKVTGSPPPAFKLLDRPRG
jgi:hypothetical protein